MEEKDIQSKALLCLDVPTRWNSTYLILEACFKFLPMFERLLMDENYKQYFGYQDDDTDVNNPPNKKHIEGPPKEIDWEKVKVFVLFIRTFYELILKFSGSYYVTSNQYFPYIFEVKQALNALEKVHDPTLGIMATNMNMKFDKYWGNLKKMNKLLFFGLILDSRSKI